MKLGMQNRRSFRAAFSVLALGSLMAAGTGLPSAHADASVPGTAIAAVNSGVAAYADDSDKGKKKGDKGGTAPIIIGPPIIVPDPPKPKKKG